MLKQNPINSWRISCAGVSSKLCIKSQTNGRWVKVDTILSIKSNLMKTSLKRLSKVLFSHLFLAPISSIVFFLRLVQVRRRFLRRRLPERRLLSVLQRGLLWNVGFARLRVTEYTSSPIKATTLSGHCFFPMVFSESETAIWWKPSTAVEPLQSISLFLSSFFPTRARTHTRARIDTRACCSFDFLLVKHIPWGDLFDSALHCKTKKQASDQSNPSLIVRRGKRERKPHKR